MELTRKFGWVLMVASLGLVVALLGIASGAQASLGSALPPPYPTGDPNVPAIGFESDMDEDGVIEICPGPYKASLVTTGMADINSTTSTLPGADPTYAIVASGEWCEIKVVQAGGPGASFYARVVFAKHPDQLQISDRFIELPTSQRQATATHEETHAGGEDHPFEFFKYFCNNAVVSTYEKCKSIGNPRVTHFAPEDAAAMLLYWDGTPYPIHNKCWTTACEEFGPPKAIVGTKEIDGEPSQWVGTNQGTPIAAPPVGTELE